MHIWERPTATLYWCLIVATRLSCTALPLAGSDVIVLSFLESTASDFCVKSVIFYTCVAMAP